MPEDLPTRQMNDPKGSDRWGRRQIRDLLAASAAGVRRGTPEDLPTRQMNDPKGSDEGRDVAGFAAASAERRRREGRHPRNRAGQTNERPEGE